MLTHVMSALGNAWRTFVTAMGEEWRAIFSDKGAMTVIVAGALAYALLYPLPFVRQLARDIPIIVVDQDQTAMSRQLTRMVDATEQVHVAMRVSSTADGEASVRIQRTRGAMVIPVGFEQSVLRGDRTIVGAYGDASYLMVYNQIATGIAQSVATMSAGVEVRRLQASGFTPAAALVARDPLPLSVRALYNPSGGYGNTTVPAVLILILQQTLLIGIGSLAGVRRELGTAPHAAMGDGDLLHRVAGVFGAGIAYVVIYFVHLMLFFGVVYRVYDLPQRGSMFAAALFLVPFLLAVAFLGLAISRLFRERESAMLALLFSSLPAMFISGFSFPAESMPAWTRAVAQLLPSTHGIDGAVRVLQMGAALTDVRRPWLALWALAGAYFVLAIVTLRPHDKAPA
jgi:ABC-2 type transport system permease protein